MRKASGRSEEEQLLLYARDLRHLVEVERKQRALLESAYLDTVSALAAALGHEGHRHAASTPTACSATRSSSRRCSIPAYAANPSLEYGFLLHDIGKIGVPEQILHKPGPLNEPEWRVMRAHSRLGAKMVGGIAFLQGAGVEVIRSHHERWDGAGYPDGMGGQEIPLGARIFAVADSLDAITNHRPYRAARSWRVARNEIIGQAGKQFDPQVIEAFRDREHVLHEIRCEFLAAA